MTTDPKTTVVPVEATEEMIVNAVQHIGGGSTFNAEDRQDMARDIYRAMLAAAPQPVSPPVGEGGGRGPSELERAVHELLWPYFESAKFGHFTHEDDCSRAARQIAGALKPGFYLSRFLATAAADKAEIERLHRQAALDDVALKMSDDTIATLQARIAELEGDAGGEPVAWRYRLQTAPNGQSGVWLRPFHSRWGVSDTAGYEEQPLYAAPPAGGVALSAGKYWWNPENDEEGFSCWIDAFEDATHMGYEHQPIRLQRAAALPEVWAVHVDLDTDGDGEADDAETLLFATKEEAEAFLALRSTDAGEK